MMEQRTPEWFEARLGKLTASNMASAMYYKKNGEESQERINLKRQILAERLTGMAASVYINSNMQHGNDQEPVAKEILTKLGFPIKEVGFVEHPRIKDFGASPDSINEEGGVLEIKCPTTAMHIKYIMDGVVPEEHKPQLLAQIACTGSKFADFVSFDPRIKGKSMRIFARRFIPSAQEILAVEFEAKKILAEILELEQIVKLSCI